MDPARHKEAAGVHVDGGSSSRGAAGGASGDGSFAGREARVSAAARDDRIYVFGAANLVIALATGRC
jgi:hypothetical protein